MGIWYFWEDYLRALDSSAKIGVQRTVTTPPQLNRETNAKLLSRFLSSIKRMPKAWGSRPWTSKEIDRARSVVANDLYRRRVRRDYTGTPRV